jgi:hypothetical protein
MSAFVAMQTRHILKQEKLSKKPPIVCEPKLSAENGPMEPLNVWILSSTLTVKPS